MKDPFISAHHQIKTANLTRRTFLQGVGCAIAAAGLPFQSASAASTGEPIKSPATDDTVMATLSAYMSEAANREIPSEVSEKAKHHILDTFAAMVSGVDLPPAVVALKFARAHAGEKVATIVGSDLLCGAMEAALVNGMLAHSDETDDSHAPSHTHPGCSIVPAAFAAGEQFGTSGARLLRAVTLGYDIGPRMALALGGLSFQMETHRSTHSIGGNFGAAAAAGCTAGLSAQQMRWLLDYTAQQASGVAAWMRDLEHVSKSLVFGGRPAHNAVESALMIQLGATGVDDILSGQDNFFLALTPKADPAKMIDQLGERYEVTRTNIKKWTVGSPIQAPLDAMQNLRKQRSFEADAVQKVVVRVATSEAKTVNNRNMPDICMQHLVAVMVLDKTVSFAAAHDKSRMQDPLVVKMRSKVQLVPDEELERLYPERQSIVEVTLTDGSTLRERIKAVRGTAENPMTRDEVITKSRDLMAPRLGAEKCDRFIESIFDLENLKDVRTLRPLLQRS
jgi:2-methylcitrate dehydratase PrpD